MNQKEFRTRKRYNRDIKVQITSELTLPNNMQNETPLKIPNFYRFLVVFEI